MSKVFNLLSDIWFLIRKGRHLLFRLHRENPDGKDFGSMPAHSSIAFPCHIGVPKNLYVEDYVKIRYGFTIVNTKTEIPCRKKLRFPAAYPSRSDA